ncbi:hypothetical protein KC19_5G182000 [Ceratodon purpureus]|uniref:Uncharacterized protein n=1 Tax=Ceratodon purpureus TaxID=3225 RepID=A0A8T0I5G4_CERPU|nr:hypothetical protein KC19_5G182000 [Ceratodon purpureus]
MRASANPIPSSLSQTLILLLSTPTIPAPSTRTGNPHLSTSQPVTPLNNPNSSTP